MQDPVALERSSRRIARTAGSTVVQEDHEGMRSTRNTPRKLSSSALNSIPATTPQEKASVNERLDSPLRRSTRKSVVQSGDYKLLASGVPLNAIRQEPLFYNEDR